MKIGDPTRTPKPLVWEWGVYKKTAKGLGGGLMAPAYRIFRQSEFESP